MAASSRGADRYRDRVAIRVSRLQVAPVKGLDLTTPPLIHLDPGGVREDRRFLIVSDQHRVLYRGDLRRLAGTSACYDEAASTLALRFADGERIEEPLRLARPGQARGYAQRPVNGRLVTGSFADALSSRVGRPVALWHCDVGAASDHPVTLVSEASLARVAQRLSAPGLDPARFRMTMHIDGLDAYAEDGWDGQVVRIGQAQLRLRGPVPRCVVTTLDPATLRRDHDVLRTLLADREAMSGGEPPFGLYASVVTPGRVAVGDPVALVDAAG
jgi:uncharacterized protein